LQHNQLAWLEPAEKKPTGLGSAKGSGYSEAPRRQNLTQRYSWMLALPMLAHAPVNPHLNDVDDPF
jgi:hypothetical protein